MKASSIRKVVEFLTYKELGEVDFTWSEWMGEVKVSIAFGELSSLELTNIKRVFGPLKARVSSYDSNLIGERKLDDATTIKVSVTQAFECKELAPEDLTDVKLDKLAENIRAGTIKVQDCTPKVLPT